MKKLLLIFCMALATQVFMACAADDNPVDTTNMNNPQNQVTDQPANAPAR